MFHNRRADGLGWVAVFSMARCLRLESPWRASRRTLPSCTWHRTMWARKRSVRALQHWCACRHSGCASRGPSRFTTCPTRIMLGPTCWWQAHCMPRCTASIIHVSRLCQRSQRLAGHTLSLELLAAPAWRGADESLTAMGLAVLRVVAAGPRDVWKLVPSLFGAQCAQIVDCPVKHDGPGGRARRPVGGSLQ